MRTFRWPGGRYDLGPSAVTVGKFDGVHRGHRSVLRELVAYASSRGLVSVALTFDRNPLAVVAPERCPEPLVGQERRLELLADAGVDAALIVTFDRAFSQLTPREFAEQVLVAELRASAVLVGADFRFGRGNAGDVDELRRLGSELGFEVVLVGTERPGAASAKYSSSDVRQLLVDGDVAAAAEVLGRPHDVTGVVVHGLKRGRELGFPTANLGPGTDRVTGKAVALEGLIPADGVYAGRLVITTPGFEASEPAAVSVGTNPTFGDVPRTVEAHVIGRSGQPLDLYGLSVRVEFVDRLRGMVAYRGPGPLIEQIRQDVHDAAVVLGVTLTDH